LSSTFGLVQYKELSSATRHQNSLHLGYFPVSISVLITVRSEKRMGRQQFYERNRHSSVGIENRLRAGHLEESWFDSRPRLRIFSPLQSVQTSSGAHSARTHLIDGFWRLLQGVNLQVLNNSLPSSAVVKNEWSYTPTQPSAFMACTVTALHLPLRVQYCKIAYFGTSVLFAAYHI